MGLRFKVSHPPHVQVNGVHGQQSIIRRHAERQAYQLLGWIPGQFAGFVLLLKQIR